MERYLSEKFWIFLELLREYEERVLLPGLLLRSGYNYYEISRQGIEQLGSPFGCTVLLFALKLARDYAYSSTGKSLASAP